MKTLIAALALSLAASAPALAFDPFTDVGHEGDVQSYDIRNTGSFSGQVSGFTGVSERKPFNAMTDVGPEGNMVSSVNHAGSNTFGFRIQPSQAGAIVLENDPVR